MMRYSEQWFWVEADAIRTWVVFFCSSPEVGARLRNRKKKDGQKATASYPSFSAPCMAATLVQFVGLSRFMTSDQKAGLCALQNN